MGNNRRKSLVMVSDSVAHCTTDDITSQYDLQLDRVLGEGAFGRVVVGVHKPSGEERAVKQLEAHDKDDTQEIIDEFDCLRQLHHPHVLRTYGMFQEDISQYHIVTDLCQGGDMIDYLDSVGAVPEAECKAFLHTLLSSINYLHTKHKLAHRDLKLENILLATPDNLQDMKVIDFGLARECTADSHFTELVGSTYYVSPQVIEGNYTSKCDIWSIGVIAYMLLGGYPPFDGRHDGEILQEVCCGAFDFNDPECWDGVSDQAKDFICNLLAYEESERPTAAQALKHSWFSTTSTSDDEDEPAAERIPSIRRSLASLSKFASKDRPLKQVVCSIVAAQLLSSDLTKAHMSTINEAFRVMDSYSCSGTLSRDDLQQAVKEAGTNDTDVDAILEQVNHSKTGSISYAEFVVPLLLDQPEPAVVDKLIRVVFDMLDHDKDSRLSTKDLQTSLGLPNVEDMLKPLGGSISPDDFQKYMKETTTHIDHSAKDTKPTQPPPLRKAATMEPTPRRQSATPLHTNVSAKDTTTETPTQQPPLPKAATTEPQPQRQSRSSRINESTKDTTNELSGSEHRAAPAHQQPPLSRAATTQPAAPINDSAKDTKKELHNSQQQAPPTPQPLPPLRKAATTQLTQHRQSRTMKFPRNAPRRQRSSSLSSLDRIRKGKSDKKSKKAKGKKKAKASDSSSKKAKPRYSVSNTTCSTADMTTNTVTPEEGPPLMRSITAPAPVPVHSYSASEQVAEIKKKKKKKKAKRKARKTTKTNQKVGASTVLVSNDPSQTLTTQTNLGDIDPATNQPRTVVQVRKLQHAYTGLSANPKRKRMELDWVSVGSTKLKIASYEERQQMAPAFDWKCIAKGGISKMETAQAAQRQAEAKALLAAQNERVAREKEMAARRASDLDLSGHRRADAALRAAREKAAAEQREMEESARRRESDAKAHAKAEAALKAARERAAEEERLEDEANRRRASDLDFSGHRRADAALRMARERAAAERLEEEANRRRASEADLQAQRRAEAALRVAREKAAAELLEQERNRRRASDLDFSGHRRADAALRAAREKAVAEQQHSQSSCSKKQMLKFEKVAGRWRRVSC